jgi:hypothetical protein
VIKLICKKCGQAKMVSRDGDPPGAAEVLIMCPDCNPGDFDAPTYFDADGREVTWATVDEVLAVHAQFGRLNFSSIKEAMGPNWPSHWDTLGPGRAIFEPED